MNEQSHESASQMLSILGENLTPQYDQAHADLLASLSMAGSSLEHLRETAARDSSNARLLLSFAKTLPQGGESPPDESDTFNKTGYISTTDESSVPSILSSAVWLPLTVRSVGCAKITYTAPYYKLGANLASGSVLLAKVPLAPDATHPWKNNYREAPNDAPHLIINQLGRRNSWLARRRVSSVESKTDNFYKPVEPADVKDMFYRDSGDLRIQHYHRGAIKLPPIGFSKVDEIDCVTNDQLLAYNVIPTINLMALRFGKSEVLQSLYKSMHK